MFIEIQSNVKIELAKIYLLKLVNRQFVDNVFDKLINKNE